MGLLNHHPAWGQLVYASAPVGGITGFSDWIVDGGRFIRVHRSRGDPFSDLGGADHRSPVIKDLDQVILLDVPGFSVFGVDPDDPVVVSLYQYPVILNIVNKTVLGIPHRIGDGEISTGAGTFGKARCYGVPPTKEYICSW